MPPLREPGLPMLKRALERAVASQVDIVRNLFAVVDRHRLRPVLNTFPIEFGAGTATEHLERAGLADRVRTLKDPVLPCGEPAENARLHGLAAGEPQARLHPC